MVIAQQVNALMNNERCFHVTVWSAVGTLLNALRLWGRCFTVVAIIESNWGEWLASLCRRRLN